LAKQTRRVGTAAAAGKAATVATKASAKSRGKGASRPAKTQQVYFFGDGRADGHASMKELLGGKGANLAEMVRLGVPVPAGFTISTEVCTEFYRAGRRLPESIRGEVLEALAKVERVMGGRFGDPHRPLLVSVRSGSRASMPGMMDTVLNLGLNDDTVEGLAEQTGDRRFAFDSYRRFVQMYGDVVLGIERDHFEERLTERKRLRGVKQDVDLGAQDLADLVKEFMEVVKTHTGEPFPHHPLDQLWGAIAAVFRSWNTPRAITYRKLENIPDDWGTAVNVQAMVFGNLGDDSATGVAFTRDPSTGEHRFFGEYLPKAQGEDVVAGIRTPHPIAGPAGEVEGPTLQQEMPRCFNELQRIAKSLEKHYRDMLDLEFTIQGGKLWMLQTRVGKRTARAAVRIAVEMVRERRIDREEAIRRVAAEQLSQLLHPTLDRSKASAPIGQGLGASPGAVSGEIVFSAEAAEERAAQGIDVILVRRETSPEDIHGMHAARGILTALGGMTSHAAVVARGMGKCCVAGCGALEFSNGRVALGGVVLKAGDIITLDGSTGEIFRGRIPTIEAELGGEFTTLMSWADACRRLRVRSNADTPEDAAIARRFGAEGIGLCRTEHMFFQAERILQVRRMIIAETMEQRAAALAEILPMQRGDFIGIFSAMDNLPVTVRLLDPPLHEFLPHERDVMEGLARSAGVPLAEVERKVEALREANPMLGHRGCRLAITYPEIYDVQVRAIVEAACECAEQGIRARPEIMIPLVLDPRELAQLRQRVLDVAAQVQQERGRKIKFTVGTMLEVPRAAILAREIAEQADFFSFGTNDLTQTTLALSRDDAGRFLPAYIEKGILPADPFVTLDREGVGALIRSAVRDGRETRPDLKIGICGEHGGDSRSVHFFEEAGLDYVSCSPFRVPIARLAAAQAALAARSAKPARAVKAAKPARKGARK
jgi:pyruvate, orthophosphate dikinase